MNRFAPTIAAAHELLDKAAHTDSDDEAAVFLDTVVSRIREARRAAAAEALRADMAALGEAHP